MDFMTTRCTKLIEIKDIEFPIYVLDLIEIHKEKCIKCARYIWMTKENLHIVNIKMKKPFLATSPIAECCG